MSISSIIRPAVTLAFLVASSVHAFAADKGQTINMAVTDKGFEPASVQVRKSEPVTLVITRKTDSTCAKEIVIDEHGIKTKLPLNKAVKVRFTPKKSGDLKYGCAMDKMVGGILRVE